MPKSNNSPYILHLIGFIGSVPKFLGFINLHDPDLENRHHELRHEWLAKGYTRVQTFRPSHSIAKAAT